MENVNQFLEKYNQVLTNLDKINSTLDNAKNIKTLNVTDAMLECVESFKEMKSIDRFNLTKEQIKDIDKKNDEIKDKIIKLKNKQIYQYNLKVEEINEKIKLLKSVSSLMVEEDIKELKVLKWCNIHIYNDWQRNNYKNKLDYDMLQEVFDKLSLIDKKYNLKHDELVDLTIKLNYYTQLLDDTKKEVKDDMTLIQVNNLLDKCINIYKNIINLDISVRIAYEKGKIDKETYSRYNHQTTNLSNGGIILISTLLEKKKNVYEFGSDYTLLLDKLSIVQLKLTSLENEVKRYRGECSSAILNRFKVYLGKLNLQLKVIEMEGKSANLNSQQSRLLFGSKGKVEEISLGLNKVYDKLNNDPYMLGNNLDMHINNLMKQLEVQIKDLNILVGRYKKGDDRTVINEKIENIKESISNIEKYVTSNNKVEFRNALNRHEGIFNKICKEYNKKCPLLVKKVIPANSVYKKYKKECLEIAGLSSFSLLDNPTLIPTIMHGNIVLQQKMPVLKKFTNFVNNILGGTINAKKDENDEWRLSNGYKIGPSVACTSILKNMALSDSKFISSAFVQKVRNLSTKMSLMYNDSKAKYDRRKLERDFERSGETVEEFVKNNNLSDVERKLIEANYEYRHGRSKR